MSRTIEGPDGRPRCSWCKAAPEFFAYHDAEWGFPVADDRRLFEKISLEGFQSGLSWRTILAKRENFRDAFHGFDFARVAEFTEHDVERLLQNRGIIRHRGKIEAVINNAQRALELIEREGSIAAYVWDFEPDPATLAPHKAPPRPMNPWRSPRTSRNGAGSSSARPRSTPSCRPWASSTTMSKTA